MQNSKINSPANKQLSVVIVNYRSKQYLAKCVASVYGNLKQKTGFEVIIVNNDASENLTDIASDYPEIKIISQGKNIGFGLANNIGAKTARGKLLWFLNPDTELVSGIDAVIAEFDKNHEVGIIGPKLIDERGRIQWWCAGGEINFWDILKNNLGWVKSKKIWESKEKKEVDWVSGASLFIKKEIFEALGGFDEKFFMYFEDIDLCKRVKAKNKKVVYFPSVAVKHWSGKSNTSKKAQKEIFYRSQDYYFKKHYGGWQAKAVRFFRKLHV